MHAAKRREAESNMSWDFSTDPEYAAQLEWADAFVREQLWPIETLFLAGELDMEGLDRAIEPLKDEVRANGLWATHLDPELGGQGHGQV
jgi:acyl-CoA dehydrogenase